MITIKGIINRVGRTYRVLKKSKAGIAFAAVLLPYVSGASSLGSSIFSGLWSGLISSEEGRRNC